MAITIPHTFVAANIADANDVNENFDAVLAEINGNLVNANFDSSEDLIAGDVLLEESKFKFTSTAAGGDGHSHDDSDSEILALAVAGDGDETEGTQGSLKYKTGTTGLVADGANTTVTFAEAFVSVPLIACYVGTGTAYQVGMGSNTSGYYWGIVAITGFKIYNESGGNAYFRWVAIGV